MLNTKLTDGQLVSRYKNGNEEAFAVLLNRHKNRVLTTIYLIVKDRFHAEDLMQEVFIKVIKTIKSGKYNEKGKFLPWILRIAHNLAIDAFRNSRRNPEIVVEDGVNVFNALDFADAPIEKKYIEQDAHNLLRQHIKELPKAQKEVLVMRHYQEMGFKEIADATGVSINTALGRMRYALINLRKKLKNTHIAYDRNFYEK